MKRRALLKGIASMLAATAIGVPRIGTASKRFTGRNFMFTVIDALGKETRIALLGPPDFTATATGNSGSFLRGLIRE